MNICDLSVVLVSLSNKDLLSVRWTETFRDQEALEALKEELASYGVSAQDVYGYRMDRETSAKVDRLKKEITNLECDMLTLPEVRARACEDLQDAIEDGTVKVSSVTVTFESCSQTKLPCAFICCRLDLFLNCRSY